MIIIDARGHRCPVPTLRLRKAMETAPPDTLFRLLATDPMARIDAPHLAAEMGAQVMAVTEAEGVLIIDVRSPASPEA